MDFDWAEYVERKREKGKGEGVAGGRGRAGVGKRKRSLTVNRIEQTKGKYNWEAYDVLVNSLAPYNITPYLILDYSNRFYDNGTSPTNRAGSKGGVSE